MQLFNIIRFISLSFAIKTFNKLKIKNKTKIEKCRINFRKNENNGISKKKKNIKLQKVKFAIISTSSHSLMIYD